jgi:ABC-2 type transport system ATP-binding protein
MAVAGAVGAPIIEFSNVAKSFAGKPVLRDISFFVREGEIFGLIGPSGSGKTTILRTLIGFYPPDHGTVRFAGAPVASVRDLTMNIGFSTQDECFYDDLTVLENLRYFGRVHGMSGKELEGRIIELLAIVELDGSRNTLAKRLSGGMRRRLDLAIALVHKPRVLILDEPTNGLDPVLRKHMLTLVKRISKQGIGVIITSHLLEDLERLCDNVAILLNGVFVACGPPSVIRSEHIPYNEIHLVTYPGDYTRILQAATAAGAQALSVSQDEHALRLSTMQTEETVYALLRVLPGLGEHLIDIDVLQPTLSSVFESIIDGSQAASVSGAPGVQPAQPASGAQVVPLLRPVPRAVPTSAQVSAPGQATGTIPPKTGSEVRRAP